MTKTPRNPLRNPMLTMLALLWLMAPDLAAAESVRLELSRPVRVRNDVVVDIKLHNMFDAELMATLRSGLPAILDFRWTIWQERHGRRDLKAGSGSMRYRIFFDVLEEDYNIFNVQGRPLAACDNLVGVESIICNQEGFIIAESRVLSPDKTYYVKVEVIIEALAADQVRGFENWLLDQTDDSEGDDDGLTAGLNGVFRGLVRNIAGIHDKSVSGRSPSFQGWPNK